MDAVSYTDFKRDPQIYMDKVVDDCEPFIITREQKENVVLISLDEYNKMYKEIYSRSL